MVAVGARPNTQLFASVEGKAAQVLCVDDCVEPRGIREAVEKRYCVWPYTLDLAGVLRLCHCYTRL